jgi:hypothetical protein
MRLSKKVDIQLWRHFFVQGFLISASFVHGTFHEIALFATHIRTAKRISSVITVDAIRYFILLLKHKEQVEPARLTLPTTTNNNS